MIRTISELVEASHEMALEKGWWPESGRRFSEIIVLFHSEISEAFEEYRAGRMQLWQSDGGKPEGFFVEIADLVIRLADAAGWYGWELPDSWDVQDGEKILDAVELCSALHNLVEFMDEDDDLAAMDLLIASFIGAEDMGHDLWESINLKLEYNKTRPYRHGNKAA